MTGGVIKVLILAGRLNRDDISRPLGPLLDRLECRGLRPQVLCLSKGGGLAADPRVFEVPALGSRWLRGLATRWVWSEDGPERPDLLHVIHDDMEDVALALSETDRLPYIQTVATFAAVDRGLRLSRRWCRRLAATNHDLAEELVERLGVPADQVVEIPPGIVPPREPSRISGDWKVPVIGTGGPPEEASGLMTFLEAARLVLDAGYDAEFVIAGPGGAPADLRRLARQLDIGERVTLVDYPVVGTELWTVLEIYCQPTIVPSTGRSLLQSLAHAVPGIATDVKGLRGLIEPGSSGLIVPPGDPRALGRAIIALLDDPEEASRLGHNGRERIRIHFDPDVEADRLVELYRRVAGTGMA